MTSNPSQPISPTPTELIFLPNHRPKLDPGDYEIEIRHKFQTSDTSKIPSQTFTATKKFRVEGERFQLKPDDIQAVFPPKGSLGDHNNVLPHIILTHSTFPWERNISSNKVDSKYPWLLLLVFNEAETPETKVTTLGELRNQGADFPTITIHGSRKTSDPVSVIDVPRKVLEPLLPKKDELAILAHARLWKFNDQDTNSISRDDLNNNERAVIIGNRLPKQHEVTTVHLVSVEGRYNADNNEFDFGKANQGNHKVRLVSLTSWHFSCIEQKYTFANMIKELKNNHSSFRLPTNSNPDAETFLKEGFVPVNHNLRQGGKTISWYRGPFTPGNVSDIITLPIRASDALLRFYKETGMFDVGYASAWELGRLMALQSPTFSSKLYEWKRLRYQYTKYQNNRKEQEDHPLKKPNFSIGMPEFLENWFNNLSHLKGLPFKYLIPDEKLLPKESIRFFHVDKKWVKCLLDGAYSIGRISTFDLNYDKNTSPTIPYNNATGVLIRSDIVSGYPGLLVDAYSDNARNTRLNKLNHQYLSKNILLCLFEGNILSLDIHQKPEMLHFALEVSSESNSNTYTKTLRTSKSPITSRTLPGTRIIPISQLKNDIIGKIGGSSATFNSGTFASEMIEKGEKVSFYRTNKGS